MRILALAGVAGPALFSSVVVLCGALRPDYSHTAQVISELGETGGLHASVMNAAGFVPAGVLLMAFGASLGWLVPRTRLSIVGSLLVVCFGAGIAAAGVFSCDSGCPNRGISREATLHMGASLVAFVSGFSACSVWALAFRRLRGWRALWIYSAASAVVALVVVLVFNLLLESRAYTGLGQRLFVANLHLWCAVVGLYTFRVTSASTGSERSRRAERSPWRSPSPQSGS